MACLQDVLAEINALLEAEPLLRAIGYFPEKLSRSETPNNPDSATIKGFCPVHKEKAFRSLIVYEQQRRFTCTFLKCPGKAGGTLVDLYALAMELTPTAAALELVAKFDLPVDLSLFSDLGGNLAAQAATEFQQGNAEQALVAIEQAIAINKDDPGVQRLRAQILRAMDRHDEALETEMLAADLFAQQGDQDAAIDLLEGLHAAYPDLYNITTKLADAMDSAGRADERIQLLKDSCSALLASGQPVTNLEPFETYLLAAADDLEMRGRVLEIYRECGDTGKAREHCEAIIRLQLDTNDGAGALQSLECFESLSDNRRLIRAFRVQALRLTGEASKAGEQLMSLAAEARSEGNLEEAFSLLEQALTEEPQNISLMLEMAATAEEQSRPDAAAELLAHAAGQHLELRHFESTADLLREASDLSPFQPAIATVKAELFRQWTAVSEDPAQLAITAFEMDLPETAIQLCEKVICDPSSPSAESIQALQTLVDNGAAQAASTFLLRTAGDNSPRAVELLRWGAQVWPSKWDLQQQLAQALVASGEIDEGIEIFGKLATRAIEREEPAKAFTCLDTILLHQPEKVSLIPDLLENASQCDRMADAIERLQSVAATLLDRSLKQQAIVPLKSLVELEPANLQWLGHFAECQKACGEKEGAASSYAALARASQPGPAENAWRECIELQPENVDYLQEYALCLEANGRHDLLKTIRLRLLRLMRSSGSVDSIERAFSDALASAGENEEALREEYLEWLLNCGQTDKAIAQLRQRRKELESGGVAPAQVLPLLQRLCTLCPDDESLSLELARAYGKSGDEAAAVEQYRACAAHARQENHSETAIAALNELLAVDQSDQDARSTLVDVLVEGGLHDEAAMHLMHLADASRQNEDLLAESRWLERLLEVEPDDEDIVARLAGVHAELGNTDEASAHYEALLKQAVSAQAWDKVLSISESILVINPASITARRGSIEALLQTGCMEEGKAALRQWAEDAESSGDASVAVECWRRLQALDPQDAQLLESLGRLLEGSGDKAAACKEYSQAATLYNQSGDEESAARVWSRMLEIGAEDGTVRLRLAEHRFKNGHAQEALHDFMRLAEEASQKKSEEDLDSCLRHLRAIIAADPSTVPTVTDLLFRIGRVEDALEITRDSIDTFINVKDFTNARKSLEQALNRQPADADLRELNVRLLQAEGRNAEACEELMAVGATLQGKKNLKHAEDIYSRILMIDQDHIAAREALVECLMQARRSGKAFVELRALGRTCAKLHQEEQAMRAFRRALDLKSNHHETRALLVETLLHMGNVAQAKAEIQQAVQQPGDQLAPLLPVLEALLAKVPDDLEVMRWTVDVTAATSGLDEALPGYLKIASRLESRSIENASKLYAELLAQHPKCLQLRYEFARFLSRNSRGVEAGKQWQQLLEHSVASGDAASAGQYAVEARLCDPMPRSLRLLIIDALKSAGLKLSAAEEALSAAETYLNEGEVILAEERVNQAVELVPEHLQTLQRGIGLLHAHKLTETARDLTLQSAGRLLKAEREEDALELCRMSFEAAGPDPKILKVQFDALQRVGTTTQIVDTCEQWAQSLAIEGQSQEAEEAYRKALAFQDRSELRQGLAKLLHSSGRSHEAANEYFHYALFWRHGMNASDAREALEKVLELDPDHVSARVELGDIYSLTGKHEMARQVRVKAARMMSDAGNHSGAYDTYAAILKSHPQDISIYRSMIDAAVAARDGKRCQTALHKLADWLVKTGATSDAIIVYREASNRAPSDEKALKALAKLHASNGDAVAAAGVLERLGNLAAGRRDNTAALQRYRQALKADSSDPAFIGRIGHGILSLGKKDHAIELFFQQVRMLEEAQNYDQAITSLQEVLQLMPEERKARLMLSDLLLKSGRTQDAIDVLSVLADEMQEAGQWVDAVEARERIKNLAPDEVGNLKALVHIYNSLDDSEAARQALEELTSAYESVGDLEEAIACCQEMLLLDKAGTVLHRRLASLYEKNGSAEEAKTEYGIAIASSLEAGRLEEAEKDLHHVLELDPKAEDFKEQYIDLLQKQGKIEQAVLAMVEVAETAAARRDIQRVKNSLEKLAGSEALDSRTRIKIIGLTDKTELNEIGNQHRLELAREYLMEGRIPEAKAICDEAVSRSENPQEMRLQAADIYNKYCIPELAAEEYLELTRSYLDNDEFEQAVKAGTEGLAIQPQNVPLREMLIEASVALDRIDDAYGHCLELAETAYESGAFGMAEKTLRRMIRMRHEDFAPRRRLIGLLREQGNEDELKKALHELADILIQNGEHHEAYKRLREISSLEPEKIEFRKQMISQAHLCGCQHETVDDHLALASALAADGNILDAMQMHEQALEIAPDHFAARTAFIRFLGDLGQHTRVISETMSFAALLSDRGNEHQATLAFEAALQVVPGEKQLMEALAQAHVRMKLNGKAIMLYRRLLAAYTSANDVDGQVRTLESILQLDKLDTASRQSLIDLLRTASRDPEARQQQMILAQQHLDRGFPDLAEQIYRDLLNEDPANVQAWQSLVEAHLKIGTDEDLVPDYIILGDLLASQGQLNQACDFYKRAIEIVPDQIEFRHKYIDSYLQVGEESNLIPEYAALGDCLARQGMETEALKYYDKALRFEPKSQDLQHRRSQLLDQMACHQPDAVPDLTATIGPPVEEAPPEVTPSQRAELEKMVRIWQSQLKMNDYNPRIHCQIAEACERLGQMERAYTEWDTASALFLDQGKAQMCIDVCQRILRRNPDDAKMRRRLTQAEAQNDSMRILDGALNDIFQETPSKPQPETYL